jgi:hypothetical protein
MMRSSTPITADCLRQRRPGIVMSRWNDPAGDGIAARILPDAIHPVNRHPSSRSLPNDEHVSDSPSRHSRWRSADHP